MSNSGQSGPLLDHFNLPRFQLNALFAHNMPKKVHTLHKQTTLTFFQIQLVFLEKCKHLVKKLNVLLNRFTVYKNIIKIN